MKIIKTVNTSNRCRERESITAHLTSMSEDPEKSCDCKWFTFTILFCALFACLQLHISEACVLFANKIFRALKLLMQCPGFSCTEVHARALTGVCFSSKTKSLICTSVSCQYNPGFSTQSYINICSATSDDFFMLETHFILKASCVSLSWHWVCFHYSNLV